MGRYQPGRATQARILAATRDLLAETGLEGATIKAVCDRAGIGAGSFYNLFASKEEAILAVVRDAIAAVDPAEQGARTTPETVADLVEAYLKFLTGDPTVARIYLQAAASWGFADEALQTRFRRHHERRLRRLSAALARERGNADDGEIRREASFILASLNGLAMTWLLDPSTDLEAHRSRLLHGR